MPAERGFGTVIRVVPEKSLLQTWSGGKELAGKLVGKHEVLVIGGGVTKEGAAEIRCSSRDSAHAALRTDSMVAVEFLFLVWTLFST